MIEWQTDSELLSCKAYRHRLQKEADTDEDYVPLQDVKDLQRFSEYLARRLHI